MKKKSRFYFWVIFLIITLSSTILLAIPIKYTFGSNDKQFYFLSFSISLLIFIFSIFGALGSYLSIENILKNYTRAQIYTIITRKPGIHFSEITRTLQLSNGQTHWHLSVLKHFELIKTIKVKNFLTFFPNQEITSEASENFNKKQILKLETRKKIYSEICQTPGLTQSDLKKRFDLSQSTLAYHLAILEQEKIINVNKKGRMRYYYPIDSIDSIDDAN